MDDPVFVRIGEDNGQVLLMFSSDPASENPAPISHWRIDPAECVPIVEAMARVAFEADTSLKPVGDVAKASLVERHRMTLTQRFALMLSTLRVDKTQTDGQIAQTLVDIALKEVF